MTSLELQREFERLLYNRSPLFESSLKPDTDTIFGFLTIAQLRLLKQKYIPNSNTELNIQSIQDNSEDLRKLIVFTNITPASSVYSVLTKSCVYPADYLHYIRSDTVGTVESGNSTQLPNKLVNWGEMDKVITNIYNKPILRKPFIVLGKTDFLITTDSYTTVTTVRLTYLKKPADITISQTSELAEYLHEDIANLAVQIFEAQLSNDTKRNAQEPTGSDT